jgi:hypothetical protein
MVKADGIEVTVVRQSDRHVYKQYTVLPSDLFNSGETFIEAVDGEWWGIIVKPEADFDFVGKQGIHISCTFDEQFEQDYFLEAVKVKDPNTLSDERCKIFEQGYWLV